MSARIFPSRVVHALQSRLGVDPRFVEREGTGDVLPEARPHPEDPRRNVLSGLHRFPAYRLYAHAARHGLSPDEVQAEIGFEHGDHVGKPVTPEKQEIRIHRDPVGGFHVRHRVVQPVRVQLRVRTLDEPEAEFASQSPKRLQRPVRRAVLDHPHLVVRVTGMTAERAEGEFRGVPRVIADDEDRYGRRWGRSRSRKRAQHACADLLRSELETVLGDLSVHGAAMEIERAHHPKARSARWTTRTGRRDADGWV